MNILIVDSDDDFLQFVAKMVKVHYPDVIIHDRMHLIESYSSRQLYNRKNHILQVNFIISFFYALMSQLKPNQDPHG